MRKKTGEIISLVIVLGMSPVAKAATPTVSINASNLLPNTANQTIQLFVQGSDQIAGENLNFQINTGTSGPTFTAIDLITGTIFSSNHNEPTGTGIETSGPAAGRFASLSVTTASGTVLDNGLLATLTVSTVAASQNMFVLNMIETFNDASNFVLPNPVNTNNAITTIIQMLNNKISIGTADRQWTVNGGGVWASDSNWTPFAPYAQGDIANFLGAATSGTAVVSLNGERTTGTINFNNALASYNIAPGSGGILRLKTDSGTSTITDTAGNHLITAPVVLANNTNVSVTGGATLTIAGVISGSGALSLSGGGQLVLTGIGSNYGITNIAAGANLTVGNGTSSGSLGTGPINNNGQLTFSGVPSILVATPMSGSGTITVTNVVHVSNVNSASLTNITGTGTLYLDNPGGVLDGGSVLNSGQLVFNRSGNVSHAPTISGAGTLTHAGTGTTTLTGIYSASGPVAINAGTLAFGNTAAPRQDTGVMVNMKNLSMGSSTVLDSANRDLLIGNTTLLNVETKILAGFGVLPDGNPSAATDPIITSSTMVSSGITFLVPIDADAILGDGSPGSAIGQSWDNVAITESGSVIVKYAYVGDADLDGKVDYADYGPILANFGQTTPGLADIQTAWLMGDLDLSGFVDYGDYGPILATFGQGVGNPLGGLQPPAGVPEPASLLFLSIGGLLIWRRRSRSLQTLSGEASLIKWRTRKI